MIATQFRFPALLGAAFLAAISAPALAADPTGDWLVEKGVAKIRVAQCNGRLWGAVSWEKTPGGRDKNNPDAGKRNRPTLGMLTLLDFKKKPGVDEWEGKAYDAQTTGGSFETSLKPVGSDKLAINGCFLFFCDGQTWTRASAPIPSSPVNAQASKPKGAALPKPALPQQQAAVIAPKSVAPVPPGDIGDVCLLPDVARLAH